jgi:hypothetical protein
MCNAPTHVCFTPNSDRESGRVRRKPSDLLWANSGQLAGLGPRFTKMGPRIGAQELAAARSLHARNERRTLARFVGQFMGHNCLRVQFFEFASVSWPLDGHPFRKCANASVPRKLERQIRPCVRSALALTVAITSVRELETTSL